MQNRRPAAPLPRVLVVEDEPAVRDLLARMLEALGFAVDAAPTGWQGLLRLQAEPDAFRVVVLDLGLPDGPGTRLLDTLHARWPGLPVLVLTGRAERPAGADAFLQKPFDLSELAASVRSLVGAADLAGAR